MRNLHFNEQYTILSRFQLNKKHDLYLLLYFPQKIKTFLDEKSNFSVLNIHSKIYFEFEFVI